MFTSKVTVIFFGMFALTFALPMLQEDKREAAPIASNLKNEKFNVSFDILFP